MKSVTMMKFGVAIISVFAISACSIFDPNNGVRVENNIAEQSVNPYAGFDETVSTLDGEKAEKLLEEYRTEKAEAPSERLLKDIGTE